MNVVHFTGYKAFAANGHIGLFQRRTVIGLGSSLGGQGHGALVDGQGTILALAKGVVAGHVHTVAGNRVAGHYVGGGAEVGDGAFHGCGQLITIGQHALGEGIATVGQRSTVVNLSIAFCGDRDGLAVGFNVQLALVLRDGVVVRIEVCTLGINDCVLYRAIGHGGDGTGCLNVGHFAVHEVAGHGYVGFGQRRTVVLLASTLRGQGHGALVDDQLSVRCRGYDVLTGSIHLAHGAFGKLRIIGTCVGAGGGDGNPGEVHASGSAGVAFHSLHVAVIGFGLAVGGQLYILIVVEVDLILAGANGNGLAVRIDSRIAIDRQRLPSQGIQISLARNSLGFMYLRRGFVPVVVHGCGQVGAFGVSYRHIHVSIEYGAGNGRLVRRITGDTGGDHLKGLIRRNLFRIILYGSSFIRIHIVNGKCILRLLPDGIEGIHRARQTDIVGNIVSAQIKVRGIIFSRSFAPADQAIAGLGEAGAGGQGYIIVDLNSQLVVNRAGAAVRVIVDTGNIQRSIVRKDGRDPNDILVALQQSSHSLGVHHEGSAQTQSGTIRQLPANQRLTGRRMRNGSGRNRRSLIRVARTGNGLLGIVAVQIYNGKRVSTNLFPVCLYVNMLDLAPLGIGLRFIDIGILDSGPHDIGGFRAVRQDNVPSDEACNFLAVPLVHGSRSIHGLVKIQPEGSTLPVGQRTAVCVQMNLIAVGCPSRIENDIIRGHGFRAEIKQHLTGSVLIPTGKIVALPAGNRFAGRFGNRIAKQNIQRISELSVRNGIHKFYLIGKALVIDIKVFTIIAVLTN